MLIWRAHFENTDWANNNGSSRGSSWKWCSCSPLIGAVGQVALSVWEGTCFSYVTFNPVVHLLSPSKSAKDLFDAWELVIQTEFSGQYVNLHSNTIKPGYFGHANVSVCERIIEFLSLINSFKWNSLLTLMIAIHLIPHINVLVWHFEIRTCIQESPRENTNFGFKLVR